jgi:hypothetical protein
MILSMIGHPSHAGNSGPSAVRMTGVRRRKRMVLFCPLARSRGYDRQARDGQLRLH